MLPTPAAMPLRYRLTVSTFAHLLFPSGRLDGHKRSLLAETIEVVEIANRCIEDVHDDIAEVHKHPLARIVAFDTTRKCTVLTLEIQSDILGDCLHLPIRSAAANQHVVGIAHEIRDVVNLQIKGFLLEC